MNLYTNRDRFTKIEIKTYGYQRGERDGARDKL